MAWTAPRTYVSTEIITASILNTDLRDNLLETAPAKATTASRVIVASGNNAVAERAVQNAREATSETTTATSYTDLATPGPSLSATTGTAALLIYGARVSNSAAGGICHVGVDISGATTSSATDTRSFAFESSAANDVMHGTWVELRTGLTGGVNTFKLEYRVTAGTGTFHYRSLSVMAL